MAGLLDLPPEVRVIIYKSTYTNTVKSCVVSLFKPVPPAKDLVCACHNICNEAYHLYKAAYRQYWICTNFILDMNISISEIWRRYSDLKKCNLDHIENITIVLDLEWPRDGVVRSIFRPLNERGAWQVRNLGPRGHGPPVVFQTEYYLAAEDPRIWTPARTADQASRRSLQPGLTTMAMSMQIQYIVLLIGDAMGICKAWGFDKIG